MLRDSHLDLNCSAVLLDEAMQVEVMNLQRLVVMPSGQQMTLFLVLQRIVLLTNVLSQ